MKKPSLRLAVTSCIISGLTVAGSPYPAHAEKTDQQVVSAFSTVLNGKYARIAWVKGGPNNWNNLEIAGNSSQTQIYVCDTKDGARRPLAANLPTGHLTNPSITADGARVVFCVGSSQQVWISDFNGQNLKRLANGAIRLTGARDFPTGVPGRFCIVNTPASPPDPSAALPDRAE